MQTAITITDPLVESFGAVQAEIRIALSHARLNGTPATGLERRQEQVQAAWDEFIKESHY